MQVSARQLHMDMLSNDAANVLYGEKGLDCIINSDPYFLYHHNYLKWHGAIKLCVFVKFESSLEHTRSISIIGINSAYGFSKNI